MQQKIVDTKRHCKHLERGRQQNATAAQEVVFIGAHAGGQHGQRPDWRLCGAQRAAREVAQRRVEVGQRVRQQQAHFAHFGCKGADFGLGSVGISAFRSVGPMRVVHDDAAPVLESSGPGVLLV